MNQRAIVLVLGKKAVARISQAAAGAGVNSDSLLLFLLLDRLRSLEAPPVKSRKRKESRYDSK